VSRSYSLYLLSDNSANRNQTMMSAVVAHKLKDISGLGRAQAGHTAFVVFCIHRDPDSQIKASA
jgi:hypothetical protein